MLAIEVASSLERPLIQWHIKSTSKAQQGLYEYDAVSRLRDSQLGEAQVHDIANYIKRGPLWEAFEADAPAVVLIDEIDKADIEFPNDLLRELDRMEFYVYETQQLIRATHRPTIIITSNNEKELPDAFLRRCFFHYIKFPDKETMERIVDVHYPRHQEESAARGAGGVLRDPRRSWPEEEAVDLGAAGLAQAADGRGHRAGGAALAATSTRSSRRCTARCSRTSRTCTCSSGWCSCRAARGPEAAFDCRSTGASGFTC